MKKELKIFLIILALFQSCSYEKTKPGARVAKKYCASCHLFPEPGLLDKQTWKEGVLPMMAVRLGIQYYEGSYATTLDKKENAVSFTDWIEIAEYYTSQAPVSMRAQNRAPVREHLNRFAVQEPLLKQFYPSSTYIKIDPGNQVIYLGNAYDSSFSVFNKKLLQVKEQKVGKVLVHLDFNEDLSQAGTRSGVLTNIGSFFPLNKKTGTLHPFSISDNGTLKLESSIGDSLIRPVQTISFSQAGTKKIISFVVLDTRKEDSSTCKKNGASITMKQKQ